MIRVGDRHVPVHEAGGIEAIIDRHRSLTHERATSHNKKSLAEAVMRQTIDGDGSYGRF